MAEKKSFARMVGEYSGLAMMLPACILVGYAIGYGIDHWLGTSYWRVVWLLLGVAAGLRQLIQKVMVDFQKDMDAGSGED